MNVPFIPMRKILIQWAAAHKVPLDPKSYESIKRCFIAYSLHAKILN